MTAVALLGGSFDPVHVGHLVAAEAAADSLGCDEVRLIPVREQPWKPFGPTAPSEHRLAMLEAAVIGNPRLTVDGIELRRVGPSYTVDTLRELGAGLDARPFLLLGSDAAAGIPDWHEGAAIPTLAEVVIFRRAGSPLPSLPFSVRTIDVPTIDVSATTIRDRVREGRSIRYFVPEPVREYILRHRLYQ